MTKTRLQKKLLCGQNTTEAALKQHVERRKPRRCKPVKAKVVSYTEENSGRCIPDVASKFLEE